MQTHVIWVHIYIQGELQPQQQIYPHSNIYLQSGHVITSNNQ